MRSFVLLIVYGWTYWSETSYIKQDSPSLNAQEHSVQLKRFIERLILIKVT